MLPDDKSLGMKTLMRSKWSGLPFKTSRGQVGGHEGIGNVVQLGPGCETSGIKIGDRVGVKWISYACQNCGKHA